ncbi:MAG: hypothetical protein JXR23_01865 [Pontiellaceae bacterium]|nr:hypothetical protein [Pontiellaceae bacterium]
MTNSPCINWGSDVYVAGTVDLDGQPRVVGIHVDMGAYEYQGPFTFDQDNDGLPGEWERDYFGFNPDPFGDDDTDILNNVGEYIAGTDPSDPNSVFTASVSSNQVSSDGFVIEWTSMEDRAYSVLWRGTLTNANDVLQIGIEYPQNSYTDTVHAAESSGFYQIEVQLK